MNKLKVGIIGASGYVGEELVMHLLNHPMVEVAAISSVHHLGKAIADVYPALYKRCTLVFTDDQSVINQADFIYICLPNGLSEPLVKQCTLQAKKCIDMGADFRLLSESDYKTWYKGDFKEPLLHETAVYGLSEFNRDAIKKSTIIGNPGCYPTAISLGLYPLLQTPWFSSDAILIDAKSGITGAGKELSDNTHFANANEAFHPYKIANHRHTPEIEQTLSQMKGNAVTITFVPHLLPINRGILATMYVDANSDHDLADIHQLYEHFYQDETFVRVLPLGQIADVKYVAHSNYCDISLHADPHGGKLIIVSAIDNMVKGAAGQAIQNMNLMNEWSESTGLMMIPPSF